MRKWLFNYRLSSIAVKVVLSSIWHLVVVYFFPNFLFQPPYIGFLIDFIIATNVAQSMYHKFKVIGIFNLIPMLSVGLSLVVFCMTLLLLVFLYWCVSFVVIYSLYALFP